MLHLQDISLTFNPGTVNEKTALSHLSLRLAPGDFATVIGSNGAGKSTLLGAVAGSLPVDSGSITLDGQNVTFLPNHRRSVVIGRLFQDPLRGTAPSLTIEENLALAYLRSRKEKTNPFSRINRRDKEFFAEKLKLLGMGLEDRMRQPVGLLSGGQRQALTLLMAALRKPDLLLLDEHTAALDPKTAAKVLAATERIVQKDHLTTLMITHNMRDAIVHGNRLIMMYEGRIALDIAGEDKKKLTVEQLLAKFGQATGSDEADDKLLLG